MASVRPCAGAKCPDRRHDRSRYRFRRSKQPSRRNSEKESCLIAPFVVPAKEGIRFSAHPTCQIFRRGIRSEEHTSELQSLMRISYAVFCLKKKTKHITTNHTII